MKRIITVTILLCVIGAVVAAVFKLSEAYDEAHGDLCIILQAPEKGSLRGESPALLLAQQVGKVRDVTLTHDGTSIDINLCIYAKHKHLLTDTVLFRVSGDRVEMAVPKQAGQPLGPSARVSALTDAQWFWKLKVVPLWESWGEPWLHRGAQAAEDVARSLQQPEP